MKNLRKLVPQEEIDALFKEIYKGNIEPKTEKSDIFKSPSNKHKILAYKVKKLTKKILLSILPVKVEINDYKILNSFNNQNFINIGYDLENKYRFHISIEKSIFDIFEDIWNGYDSLIKENVQFNPQKLIETFLEELAENILEDINLEKKKIVYTNLSFYEDEITFINFKVLIEGNEVNMCISFDEFLLEFADIKPIIFSYPTKVGKKNLETLKQKTSVNLVYETEKIYVNADKLRKGEVINIKKLVLRRS